MGRFDIHNAVFVAGGKLAMVQRICFIKTYAAIVGFSSLNFRLGNKKQIRYVIKADDQTRSGRIQDRSSVDIQKRISTNRADY